MPPIDVLGKTKARLLAMGAIMAGGTLAGAIAASNPITGTALLSGTLAMAGSVAGGIFANDLGDIAKGLGENEEILNDRELTQAVGLAIALVIYSVAKDKQYSAHKADLERVAKKSVNYWQTIAAATEGDKDYAGVHEAQLPAIFSTNPTDFSKVRALDIPTWKHALGWLSGAAGVQLPEDAIAHVAEKLHTTFPKALREVLKHDASKGGQAFSGMLLLLLGNITAALKPLNARGEEIVKRLKGVATTQQVCQVMARVESGIRADLAEIKKAVDSLVDLLRPGLPLSSQFIALIEEKTKDFVGRDYVFTAIEDFLRHEEKGYFIIEAEPGVGKSAILANYVRDTGCVHHFNIQSGNKNRTELFLKSVCTQLIECYQLNHKNLPEEATQDSDFLERLLNEITQRGERVVIAIDALDEVDLSSQNPNANVLYLPRYLPDGVYFVMTQRPLATGELPFDVEAPTKLCDLIKEYPEQSRQDVLRYIQLATARQGVRQWIDRWRLNDEDFITQLADKSENNFMYLRYVLADIEKGFYRNSTIDKLPQKLQGYYEQHWRRMGMTAKDRPDYKVDIVYTLVELNQPVSTKFIAEIVQQERLTVQQVLNEWEQFLPSKKINNQTCYSVYHKSFRDFLYSNETVQASKVKLMNIKARIVDNLQQELYGDE